MGLFSRDKAKIKIQTTTKDSFSGWLKCTRCHELIHTNELEKNQNCCPKCDYHYRLTAQERIRQLADEGTWELLFSEIQTVDALSFVDSQPYSERLEKALEKSESDEAIQTGLCRIGGHPSALAVMDFSFMGGSMGCVVGERLTRLIELASEKGLPLVTVSASGGARMQESILSLMQMAKTSAALARHDRLGLPFISILTNPTSGGVTASYASLGDLILAEPGALICFAGPRVIEQTIKQKLPAGAQQSEFLLKHGMVDCIVPRRELKETVVDFIRFLTGNDRGLPKEDWPYQGLPPKLQELMSLPDPENPKKKESNKKSKSRKKK